MKDTQTKLEFIRLRAEGKSFSYISKELGIAKATCSSWEHSLADQIEELKQERLEELYTAYSMTKEARIESLGSLLKGIDGAIASKSLEELPLEKLLELRLKYGRQLQTEYKEPLVRASDHTLDGLLEEYEGLYKASQSGSLNNSDVKAQLSILDAKRDTLYRIATEKLRESDYSEDFTLDYRSSLIRHEDEDSPLAL